MATFISLISWTDQGIRAVKETLKRADAAVDLARKFGGSLTVYWTVGPYDIVALSEFDDEETATAYLLAVGSLGNVRSTTLRAFGRQEMEGILAKLA
ncbi:MAG: GYD domain-containing protein [Actinomycetota bacterium]